jgi:D-alanyl-D-alanine carboxypeptidase
MRNDTGTDSNATVPAANISNETDLLHFYESLLVNSANPLPEQYSVALLDFEDGTGNVYRVAKVINEDLEALFQEARLHEIELCINSAYRSNETQEQLYESRVQEAMQHGESRSQAEELTNDWVAQPGTSEHETGLAVDFGLLGTTTWDEGYGWLAQNAHRFGFILRYPEDKMDITKVANEPWHYRYVGKDLAKELQENELCLEEYLELE